jgi:hypothetical protein
VFEVINQFYPGIQNYYANLSINLQQFVGAKLLQIDGVDALPFFAQYAKVALSTSKDVQTRFNLALYVD